MRPIALFLVFILGGLLLTVLAVAWIEPACSAGEKLQPDRGKDDSKYGGIDKYAPDGGKSAAAHWFMASNIVQAAEQKRQPPENQAETPWYQRGWWKTFFCEMKIGDAAIGYFTYCLVVVGAFQGFWMWRTAELSGQSLRDMERAHLFGGPYLQGLMLIDNRTNVYISIGNHGRTFAILKELYVEASATEPSGPVIYNSANGKTYRFDTAISTDTKATPISADPFHAPFATTFYCFGYMRYLDIFGRPHVNRFCNEIDPVTRTSKIAGPPVWNEFD